MNLWFPDLTSFRSDEYHSIIGQGAIIAAAAAPLSILIDSISDGLRSASRLVPNDRTTDLVGEGCLGYIGTAVTDDDSIGSLIQGITIACNRFDPAQPDGVKPSC